MKTCTRPIKGLPAEYGPIRHDYLLFPDGTTISYGPEAGLPGVMGGKGHNTSNDSGGTCSKEIELSKSQEERIKEWAEKHKTDTYFLEGNNCRDFANKAIICGIEGC